MHCAQADVRLFQTLIRFDHVYVVYFKCNRNFIHQMPNLCNYVRDLYQTPGESAPGLRMCAQGLSSHLVLRRPSKGLAGYIRGCACSHFLFRIAAL